jgi:protein phosphatase
MNLNIPELSLVVLIGPTGSGKSTFARAHFKPTEVISSDFCRGLVADDENDQSATPAAFELLRFIAGQRLKAGRLTVIDATNVQPEARRDLVALAREHDVLPAAIVLDLPEDLCAQRNKERPDRDFGSHVLRRQRGQLRRGLRGLGREGFRTVHVLRTPTEVDAVTITRTRLYSDRRDESGPFDIIGDVHGCRTELEELLTTLAYELERDPAGRPVNARHPGGRRVIFVGDLVDRGPDTPGVLRLVMGMTAAGTAFCVAGNHEAKLLKALRGKNVKRSHGLDASMEQLDLETPEFRAAVDTFIDGLISHYVFDQGNLVVAHAGLVERYHGRASGRVREFCLYGETTGETDEYGLPVRYPWATEYRGRAVVVYGHTPVPAAEWLNNTLCVDTGCVFGGRLTAMNYPERGTVSVPAHRVYHPPAKPFPAVPAPGTGLAGRREPDLLDIEDVSGSRVIETAYLPRVGVRDAHAAAALEVMSRFGLDPHWLLYLPPTMAPVATSTRDDLLEHPEQAFSAYAAAGVGPVVCEEKHMGSRAVLLVCRSEQEAAARFGVSSGSAAVWTRTGRPFFSPSLTVTLADRMRVAAEAAGLFDELGTSWLLFDAEILPWNVKAGSLLRDQYAAVGAAAQAALPAAVAALTQASSRELPGVDDLLGRTRARLANAGAFTAAYARYCWDTDGLAGVRVAPFQLLATEGAVYHERPHPWHLALAARLAAARPELVTATRHVEADTGDAASVAAATRWWEGLTEAGGEGMVVKPAANLVRGPSGLAQPGLKVRGREYLRIIYGPDYTEPANLARLRQRGLSHKRSLALREYALGLEALDRVARGEPLWRVHECVFAVLALESEPVDPRL